MRPADYSFLALLGAVLLGVGETANAERVPPRGRWHYVVGGERVKEYSLLFQRTAEADQTWVLLESDAGRFELHSWQDPTEKDNRESIRDVASGLTFSRRLLFARYEKVAGCETVRSPDACVLFESKNGRVATSLRALAGAEGAAIQKRVADTMPEELRRKLLALEPSYRELNELAPWSEDFLGLVWPGKFKDPRAVSPRGTRNRGCDWDAAFGYPCTEGERKREDARFAERGPR